MTSLIFRRLIQSIMVVFLVSIMVFFVMRFLPGDPVLVYVSQNEVSFATPERIAEIRHKFGLDKPVIVQYLYWLGDIVRGNLGHSIINNTTVNEEIGRALPKTMFLGSCSFTLSILLGIPLGIIAAIRRGKWADTFCTLVANLGVTAPVFWVGIVLILIFGYYLKWLPISGWVSPTENFGQSLLHIIMPVLCLTVYPMAAVARQTRSSMLEVIRQDYIRTAWAKGLNERQVILKHAVRNALIPVITLIGINIRQIFGGAVLIETVFSIYGMGKLSVDALFSSDYAIVQGVILVIGVVVVFSNLIVDLSYGWIDPRIRYDD
ncbi:MAG: ABC transporter permease [Deltaproteobacteria bacterium]|nr:ABC transporter permease [Deltaproteobacteria bacterium]